jgi:predicted DNA-binding transcriptional regulator YafY
MPGARDGNPAIRTLAVLRALVAGPQTIAEMAERVGLDLRTAHRWIGYLDRAGISVRQLPTWPVQYHVDPLDLMRWLSAPPTPRRKRPR